jgi:hypothetical protein
MTFDHVSLISHADWSKNPKKRWMAIAILQIDQSWFIPDLLQVYEPSHLFMDLQSWLPKHGCILAGFDFPIGLPYSYAVKAGVDNYLSALPLFGRNNWRQFYTPAKTPSQINIYRPFYPQNPGSLRRIHLEQGLNLSFDRLYRLCETAHENRRAACPLFWTWSVANQLVLDKHLTVLIKTGFSDKIESEDQFDALVGLFGMINVIRGNHPCGEPLPPEISKIEGWIFGQNH